MRKYSVEILSGLWNTANFNTKEEAVNFVKMLSEEGPIHYYSVHSGSNTSLTEGLECWDGTDGYWACLLDQSFLPERLRTKVPERDRQIILSKKTPVSALRATKKF